MVWEMPWISSRRKPTMIIDLSSQRSGSPPGSGEPSHTDHAVRTKGHAV